MFDKITYENLENVLAFERSIIYQSIGISEGLAKKYAADEVAAVRERIEGGFEYVARLVDHVTTILEQHQKHIRDLEEIIRREGLANSTVTAQLKKELDPVPNKPLTETGPSGLRAEMNELWDKVDGIEKQLAPTMTVSCGCDHHEKKGKK